TANQPTSQPPTSQPPTSQPLLALVRRPAGDGVGLELVGIDLLALHGHLPALVMADVRRAELRLRALVVGVLALRAAEGLVLGVVVRPVLELLGRFLLELLDLLLAVLLAFAHGRCVSVTVRAQT